MGALSELIANLNPQVQAFLLVLARTGSLMIAAPFFGSRVVPVLARVWIVVALSIGAGVWNGIRVDGTLGVTAFGFTLSREVVIGLVLGWFAQLVFVGLRLAGHMIETKCGLGLIQLADPQEGGQTGLFNTFCEVLAGFVFFAVDGHHLLLKALWSSYAVFPVATDVDLTSLLQQLIFCAADIFVIALRVSAPVVVGLCFMEIILGVISRAIPQMNVFMVTQPLQLIFALLLLILAIPSVVWLVDRELLRIVYNTGIIN